MSGAVSALFNPGQKNRQQKFHLPLCYRFAVGCFLLGLLNACGNPDQSAATAVDYGPIGGASGAELAAEQTLHKSNGAEPQTLDPHKSQGIPASNILRDVFEGLVIEAPDGSLIPGAASRWEISDDGLVYRFYLHPDGRWSNGDPVTAGDFVFGLRRAVDPNTLSVYSSILYPIQNAEAINRGELDPSQLGVTALDDLTLEIRLTAPTPYFLGLLTHSMGYAVHPPTVRVRGSICARR